MTPSILVAIPTGRSGWSPEFTFSLIAMLMRPIAASLGLDAEPVIHWQYWRSSNLVQNRHNLAREAQELAVSHVLWLDDDMTFPPDTLERLLRPRLAIIGANCTTRAMPIIPTAVKNDQRIISAGRHGLESIDQFGMAVVLTERQVFDKIPLPWFKMEWDPRYPDTYCSEDMYFCRKAKACGFRVWIDHDLSNQIGHIGEMTFDHSMVDATELAEVNERALIARKP